jgi:polyhydroxyalkanoate synthesis regulator phasin
MAQTDLLKRYLDAGVAFTQLTQQKAEEIVRDLVRSGEVQTGDARKRVEELLERSKQNSEGVVAIVRAEVQNQVARLGLVPKSEVDALKRELAALKAQQPKTVVQPVPAAAKAPAKKAPAAAKAPAAKAPAAKAPAKKVVAKNTVAKKAPAAKKSATKRA